MNAVDFEPICVVIGRSRHNMFQAEIQEAVKLGARFLELRLDILAKAPDFRPVGKQALRVPRHRPPRCGWRPLERIRGGAANSVATGDRLGL